MGVVRLRRGRGDAFAQLPDGLFGVLAAAQLSAAVAHRAPGAQGLVENESDGVEERHGSNGTTGR